MIKMKRILVLYLWCKIRPGHLVQVCIGLASGRVIFESTWFGPISISGWVVFSSHRLQVRWFWSNGLFLKRKIILAKTARVEFGSVRYGPFSIQVNFSQLFWMWVWVGFQFVRFEWFGSGYFCQVYARWYDNFRFSLYGLGLVCSALQITKLQLGN